MSYKGLRVIVTGGRGFIGSNLVKRLIQLDADVVVVDHHKVPVAYNYVADAVGGANFICADICDALQMNQIVKKCDILFSLAGKSGASDSIEDPFSDLDVNCRGHLTLLEAIRCHNPHMKVIFASSRLVYGKTPQLPVDEIHDTNPTSIYGIHKLTAEKYYQLYNNLYGIKSTIVRLTNPYGPYQDVKNRGFGIINKFISQAAQGDPIYIYGEGKQLRDYVYIDDVIDALLLCGSSDNRNGEVINVGSGQGISIGHLAQLVVRIAGRGGVTYVPWPADQASVETGSFVADIQKAKRLLGWSPKVTLNQGISASLKYYSELVLNVAA